MKAAPITFPLSVLLSSGVLQAGSGYQSHTSTGQWKKSDDSHKLALTDKLLEAVVCEVRACGAGQRVIISGDLNAEPSFIPVTAQAPECGRSPDGFGRGSCR